MLICCEVNGDNQPKTSALTLASSCGKLSSPFRPHPAKHMVKTAAIKYLFIKTFLNCVAA